MLRVTSRDSGGLSRPGQDRKRIPFGAARSKLTAPHRAGFVRRWFNDVNDRISRAKDAGWDLVVDPDNAMPVGDGPGTRNTELGAAVSQVVGVDDQRNPVRAYLMEVRQDWYDEDQARKVEETKQTDRAIAEGTHGLDGDGRYLPRDGMSIR
jgi:hypothetical protein